MTDDLLSLLSLLTPGARLTLVGGKGGVGKTTTAAALAVAMADRGERVVVASLDPAHSLGDALGVRLRGDGVAVPGVPGLSALEVDAEGERERFLASHRAALLAILENGTYLDREDASDLVDRAVPGLDELAALFRIVDATSAGDARVVVDTAPTGHTLRLLDVQHAARSWLAALSAMDERHRAVALALAGGYPRDDASRLLDLLAADLERLAGLLHDPAQTRFVLVTRQEPVILAETRRYADALTARGIALGGIVVNRSAAEATEHAERARNRSAAEATEQAHPLAGSTAGMVFVPEVLPEPVGVAALRAFAASASAGPRPGRAPQPAGSAPQAVGSAFLPPLDRTIYLVGGKGGVGKSTTAAALALLLARRRGARVLLLGTDPAGSLGDVLERPVGGEPVAVEGVPGLRMQQVDAGRAWARFRDGFGADAARVLDAFAPADQRVIERLLDLAPPGIDEVVSMLEVIDALADGAYDALVLDTAPTGHLLRLLEMPDVALQWAHALLRLLLKYRAVVGLGDVAERVLDLTRSLRALRRRLEDPGATWTLVVALPEALSVAETPRLLRRLRELEIPVGALLVNRALADGRLLAGAAEGAERLARLAAPLSCVAAPDTGRGPRGPEALLALADAWRSLAPPRPA